MGKKIGIKTSKDQEDPEADPSSATQAYKEKVNFYPAGASREAITGILQEELCRKDQIKIALIINATYAKYKYNRKGKMGVLLSKKDIDKYLAQSVSYIDKKISDHLFDIIKLNGIPMPTSICPRVFNKIEKINPDIFINVWEWKKETVTPKSVIASKNYNNRPYIIHLIALTDIVKSEKNKKIPSSTSGMVFQIGRTDFEADNKKYDEKYGETNALQIQVIAKTFEQYKSMKANNPKMGKVFNPSKLTSWISYVDANNLYGWIMNQFLPIGSYK
ncbi:hypothetical protein C1645_827740 [Glomus cerebriforme]|uniref:DNA-directed DNA polymerase n=1 Tax=Glomus cerebriforme TaxID=658196 RepID=A0A397SU38_9GLOM|nr:hypothetical protein C1645_827740 [Glomus cerebriforme]